MSSLTSKAFYALRAPRPVRDVVNSMAVDFCLCRHVGPCNDFGWRRLLLLYRDLLCLGPSRVSDPTLRACTPRPPIQIRSVAARAPSVAPIVSETHGEWCPSSCLDALSAAPLHCPSRLYAAFSASVDCTPTHMPTNPNRMMPTFTTTATWLSCAQQAYR